MRVSFDLGQVHHRLDVGGVREKIGAEPMEPRVPPEPAGGDELCLVGPCADEGAGTARQSKGRVAGAG